MKITLTDNDKIVAVTANAQFIVEVTDTADTYYVVVTPTGETADGAYGEFDLLWKGSLESCYKNLTEINLWSGPTRMIGSMDDVQAPLRALINTLTGN